MKEFRDGTREYLAKIFLIDNWQLEDPGNLVETGEMAITGIETPATITFVSDHEIKAEFTFIVKYRFPKSLAYHDLPLHEIEEYAIVGLSRLSGMTSRQTVVEATISPVSKDWIISITLELSTLVFVDQDETSTGEMIEQVRIILRSNLDRSPETPAYDRTIGFVRTP